MAFQMRLFPPGQHWGEREERLFFLTQSFVQAANDDQVSPVYLGPFCAVVDAREWRWSCKTGPYLQSPSASGEEMAPVLALSVLGGVWEEGAEPRSHRISGSRSFGEVGGLRIFHCDVSSGVGGRAGAKRLDTVTAEGGAWPGSRTRAEPQPCRHVELDFTFL